MKETFKKKLDKDFRKYKIMGAYNPILDMRDFKSKGIYIYYYLVI